MFLVPWQNTKIIHDYICFSQVKIIIMYLLLMYLALILKLLYYGQCSANSPKKGKHFGKFWIKTKLTPFTYWTFCFAITGYWVQVTIQNVHWKLMVGVCLREIKKKLLYNKKKFFEVKSKLSSSIQKNR